ncbi:uncharacterized protein N0V89_004485 [Didymosphaeria variabile]|uniref:Uncharacterized protein n=1 Tax=Didymosphaeria variabile TaxID=1932322 RepID=A0A9W8XQH3_9PLEO|nr:uncharacterized protein N0V89_004485 [Didymosphaeria variabile]KAJ4356452.1 hypothetical protein N0V89_004485 [Didymosphaeria variabile]
MPNVLVMSFEGFSFSSRQLYEQLLPKLLSRAAIHESLTIQDALNHILSGWPNVILVTDPVIAEDNEESQNLLETVSDYTKQHCCTTILMGFFAGGVGTETLDYIFKHYFDLKWKATPEEPTTHEARLVASDQSLLRTTTLVRKIVANAAWLTGIPPSQAVYFGPLEQYKVYAAFTRVGLGKLGYIGDTGFADEPERLVLAMCHLDRPEDRVRHDDEEIFDK